jgi:hypothetical protein
MERPSQRPRRDHRPASAASCFGPPRLAATAHPRFGPQFIPHDAAFAGVEAGRVVPAGLGAGRWSMRTPGGGWRDVLPERVRQEVRHFLDGLASLHWGLTPGYDTATPELADIAEVVAVSEWMFRGFRAGLLREAFVAQFEVHPRSLTKADLAAARALLRDPTITVEDAAARVGCSPATLYRYLPGGRGSLVDGNAMDRSAA